MAAQRGPSNPMRIDQEGKFYTKLLSREMISLQGEAYYGEGLAIGSVPFAWESQPGTPIATATTTAMTVPNPSPPPSYFYPPNCGKMKQKKIPRFKSITAILVRLRRRRKSKLQSSSWPSSPSHCCETSCCLQNDECRSSWPEEMEDKVVEEHGGSRFLFCFRVQRTPRVLLETNKPSSHAAK